MDCSLEEAIVRIERIQKWVCGNYTLAGRGSEIPVRIGASMGVAQWAAEESVEQLLDRADAAMYQNKSKVVKP
jgi:PleD family two-component response regulator